MTYYKKYRREYGTDSPVYAASPSFHPHPLTLGGGGGGGSDGTATNYYTWEENPASLSRSSSVVRRGPWYKTLKKKFKLKSKSMEERTTPSRQMPPITRQAKFQLCSYSSSSSASPLGGLSSMLSDKMTASTSSQSQDETQSRDSGHSSGGGGSPDLRGLRLQGGSSDVNEWQDAPSLPYRGYQARSTDQNWYFRRSRTRTPYGQWVSADRDRTMQPEVESDAKSICSYETATDYGCLMNPPTSTTNATQTSGGGLFQEGVECESSNAFLENSGCNCRRGTRSPSPSETGAGSRLDYWCPGANSTVRQRMISPSHRQEGTSTYSGADTDKRLRRSGNALPLPLPRTITRWCLRFWLILKIFFAFTSCCFLLLVFLFAYRSWRCENDAPRIEGE